jgi:hypothetical protein
MQCSSLTDNFLQTTQRYIPEDRTLQSKRYLFNSCLMYLILITSYPLPEDIQHCIFPTRGSNIKSFPQLTSRIYATLQSNAVSYMFPLYILGHLFM